MKRVLAFCLCLIMCFLTGCTEIVINRDVTAMTGEFMGVFNPLFAESEGDKAVCDLVFDSIVEISESGDVIAGLANYEVLENGNKYRFELKKANFTDGVRLKASDVLFTLKILADKSYNGNVDLTDCGIIGFDEYKKGFSDEIKGFVITEDGGFNIVLKEPNPGFLSMLTFGILSEEYYGKDFKKGDLSYIRSLDGKPLGSGQYIFGSYMNDEVSFTANKTYFKGCPEINDVLLVRQGNKPVDFDICETDFALETVKKLPAHNNYKIKNYACNVFYNFGFNCNDALFSNKNIRKALSMVIDFEKMSDAISDGGDGKPFVFGEIYAVSKDNDSADKILEKEGYKKDSDGFYTINSQILGFTVSVEKGAEIEGKLAERLVEDMKDFGVKAEIKEVENIFDKAENGEEQSFIISTEDGGKYFGVTSFKTQTVENVYNFSDAGFDKAVENYDKNSLTDGMKKMVADNVPCIPLYMKLKTIIYTNEIPKVYASSYRSIYKNLYSIKFNK